MSSKPTRRDFVKGLAAGVVAGGVAGIGGSEAFRVLTAAPAEVKEPVPRTPLKAGIQAFLTGGGAIWGKPTQQGAVLAIEEINERGGILGRKIEYVVKTETTPEETVREYRALVLDEKIDFFVGLISSSNTPAVGPVAEELQKLTFFVDGCTDFLFESVVTNPRFCFRITNIQSADGIAAAIGAIKLLNLMQKDKVRIAHIHPDYAYGRNAHAHTQITFEKVLGKDRVEVVYESFPGLFRVTDFSPYITEILAKRPDILVSSLWGADVINFYKQGLGFGLFDRVKFVSCIAHGASPAEAVKDFPDGHIAGVHSNYFFLYPEWSAYPRNKAFVDSYYKRWGTYPDSPAEGAYIAVYMYKAAVEKAYAMLGEWPEVDDIIKALEGTTFYGPAGPIHVRAGQPNKHQCYKDGIVGISRIDPTYGFSVLADPVTIPISKITVPEGWEGPRDPRAGTMAYTWISQTWKEGKLPF